MSQRETPYDIVFRGGDIDFDARFEAVRAEAQARGMDIDDPDRFVMLGAVGALLREMILAEEASDTTGEVWQALPADAIAQAGALLYQAYRFRDAGARVLALDEPTVRAIAAGETPTPAPVQAAGRVEAAYVQLPRNLFWARADAGSPAEPLDGFFFARGFRFDLLLALGVRPRRPGFTAIPIAADLDSRAALDRWSETSARDGADDFANILPGGDIDRLHGLTSAAEALKLAALVLRHLGVDPAPAPAQRPADG